MERLWRDIQQDTLESYRQIFDYLTENELLDMKNDVHPKNKTPGAIYELSRERAIARGYWTGDPSGDLETVANHPLCGYDGEAPLSPAGESSDEAASATQGKPAGVDVEVPQAQAQVGLSHLPSLSSGMGISLHGDERRERKRWLSPRKKMGKALPV
ncbi:hypothetical protein DFH09DRAFT_1080028 [Mycena vulgaris]|nr:hypothetical protein DFH09DRAFT_1080028 [Mycena vulgaris]